MAATQLGATVKIGFASQTYTGHLMQDFELESLDGNVEEILDEDGATETIILMNPAKQISFTAVVLDAGAIIPPTIGATITINSIPYRVTSASNAFAAGATRLSVTAIKESTMTYS